MLIEAAAEPGRGILREFRGGCIEHRENAHALARERLLKSDLVFHPRHVIGNEPVKIGIDGEVQSHIVRRQGRKKDSQRQHQPNIAGAKHSDAR